MRSIHFSDSFKGESLSSQEKLMKSKLSILSSQRLKELQELKNSSTSNDYGKELSSIDETTIYHKGGRNQYKRTLLETTEVLSSSNHKFLKIWELYEPTESSQYQWKYGRQGIRIPIKDAKKWIKRLYQHYFEKD